MSADPGQRPPPGADAALASAAARHAAIRWVGVPLLLTGLLLLVLAILSTARGGPWGNVPLGLLSTGLGLAAFGANHDAAMALAWRARSNGVALPDGLANELDTELQKDRSAILALRASPRMALVMPVVAICAQGWLAARLVA